ncbi:MAG: hypothetical protein ABL958_15060, partial [Bdellovibrionia bacterium]
PHYVLDLVYAGGNGVTFRADFSTAKLILNGQEVPLSPRNQRLQLRVSAYCSYLTTTQEVALVVNGEWQTDPVNGSHNFKLNLLY